MGLGQKAENILYFYDKNMISSTDNHSCSETFHNINIWTPKYIYPLNLRSHELQDILKIMFEFWKIMLKCLVWGRNYLLIVAAPRAETDNAEEEPGPSTEQRAATSEAHKLQVTMYDNEANL